LKKLLVLGCGRSGNTLMQSLCAVGFENVYYTRGEKSPLKHKDLNQVPKEYSWAVFKCPSLVRRLHDALPEKDMNVIFMLRDPRGALISRKIREKTDRSSLVIGRDDLYTVRPGRWVDSSRYYWAYHKNIKILQVKYEDLLTDPNSIQLRIGNRFGLQTRMPFTECYKHMEGVIDKGNIDAMRGVRPIDASMVDSWKKCSKEDTEYLRKCFDVYPEMVGWMKRYGYTYEKI